MLRRRHINADPSGRRPRPPPGAAAGRLGDVARLVEEHVIWPLADLLRGVVEVVKWPFERLVWTVERWLIWPLRERTAGWSPSARAAGAGALAALATGVLVVSGSSGGKSSEEVAAAARVAIATPTAKPAPEEPKGPVLQGVPPSFGVGTGVGVAQGTGGKASDAASTASTPGASTAASTDGAATGPTEDANAATSSKAKPAPAGPAAMKVARRFSEAFVFYEIGRRPARAKTVFGETATPQLATALGERPARLPEGAKVPKARVVNLVPGPRAGKAHTVSVSLLRVGLTSELRLELSKKNSQWLVTDVRG